MRASLLRSSPEPHRTPWPLLAFSPGFPSTQRGNAYRAMCPSPLHRHASEASTPAPAACWRFGPEGSHPRSPVPSPWFLATSMVSSASPVAGLLHPAADPGVRRVSVPGAPVEDRTARHFPATQDLPFEEFPVDSRPASPQRFALHAVVLGSPPLLGRVHCCIPALTRWEGPRPRLRGFAPSSGLVPPATVAGAGRSAPSWALFLFKVHFCRPGFPHPHRHVDRSPPEGDPLSSSSASHSLG